jgi:hypothetical protein
MHNEPSFDEMYCQPPTKTLTISKFTFLTWPLMSYRTFDPAEKGEVENTSHLVRKGSMYEKSNQD